MPDLTADVCSERAAVARARAAKTADPEVRNIHERMADDYSELALLLGPRPREGDGSKSR